MDVIPIHFHDSRLDKNLPRRPIKNLEKLPNFVYAGGDIFDNDCTGPRIYANRPAGREYFPLFYHVLESRYSTVLFCYFVMFCDIIDASIIYSKYFSYNILSLAEEFFVFSNRFLFILESLDGSDPYNIPLDNLLQVKGLKDDIHSLVQWDIHELHSNLTLHIRVNDHIVSTDITQ